MYIKVVNDRASPVPLLRRHGRRSQIEASGEKVRRLGQCSGMTPDGFP
jgi:hypothetical protein